MINRRRTLSEEVDRIKFLSGMINESEGKILNESDAHLYADKGLLLKVDDSVKSKLETYPIPDEPHDEEMTRIPNDQLHVTLTSIAGFKGVQDKRGFEELDKKIPQVILGKPKFVYRGDNKEDRRYLATKKDDTGGKTTYVVPVENQQALRDYVDAIYDEMGMDNPEPNRFFHVTIANSAGGYPFKSIGNVDRSDFQ
jgi:hypothetical protein